MTKNKKEQLFEKLVAENKDRIYRICRSWLPNQSDLPDLYQEILIGIWKSIDRFRNEASWSTYIYRIAVNTAIKHNMKSKKLSPVIDEIPEIADQDHTSEAVELDHQINLMHQCIQQLNNQDRLLISLVLEDLSYKEIADILESSVSLVGVRINRVKKRISKLIKEQHGSI